MAASANPTASASLPELQTIVIPSLEKKIGAQKFTISCEYLEHNRNVFDSKVDTALPYLQPVLTKSGKPRVHQPYVRSTTLDYWRSQCIFRGLPSSGTKTVLQQRIRDALASPTRGAMTNELKGAQTLLIREFRLQNATKRDEKWTQCTSPEARAEADAKRFLRETFSNAHKDHAVVVKTHHRMELHQAAETMGDLCTMSANAPVAESGRANGPDRWIVIANSGAALQRKIHEISTQASKSTRKAQETQDQRAKAMQEAVIKSAQASASSSGVAGTWLIISEDLDGHSGGNSKHTMTIKIGIDQDKKAQMFAVFDFDNLTGMMRFVNCNAATVPTAGQKSAAESDSGDDEEDDEEDEYGRGGVFGNDDDEDDEEDEYGRGGVFGNDDDEDEDVDEASVYKPSFVLHKPFRPSAQNAKWLFRWRCEDNGTGEIQLGSDDEWNSIYFDGPAGTECSGVLNHPFAGRVEYEGRKIAQARGPPLSYPMALNQASYEWEKRSEQAYESARVGRWH